MRQHVVLWPVADNLCQSNLFIKQVEIAIGKGPYWSLLNRLLYQPEARIWGSVEYDKLLTGWVTRYIQPNITSEVGPPKATDNFSVVNFGA